MKERVFQVVATWMMTSTVPMRAKTLEEAMEKVRCMEGLPSNGRYLDDSFQVDEELTRENNHEER